ncbi:MAG: hypothetical protein ACI83P_001933 [Janthinobacterium sp.]|jgi:hypothetical protein
MKDDLKAAAAVPFAALSTICDSSALPGFPGKFQATARLPTDYFIVRAQAVNASISSCMVDINTQNP